MKWRLFIIIFAFSIGTLVLAIMGRLNGETLFNAYALGVLAVGLGVNSMVIALNADKRTDNIEATLTRIASLQEEIKKAQEEQPGSSTTILSTLEGLSQYYLDYISRQREKNESE